MLSALLFAVGCAFDISHVRQQPASFTAVAAPVREFTLNREVKAKLGTGFPTVLKAGTRWRQVGRIAPGEVFTTKDQIVTVEASNIYEAQPVVAAGVLQGFFLPVEKTFVAASHPIPLEITTLNQNQDP